MCILPEWKGGKKERNSLTVQTILMCMWKAEEGPLKDVHILIPRTCEFITSGDKRDLIDHDDFEVVKVGSLASFIQVGMM